MTQNLTVFNHSVHIFSNINRLKSYEQDTRSFNICLNFSLFKKIFLTIYSRVGAGAAAAVSKFLPGAGAA
jgi:hypothetical protein